MGKQQGNSDEKLQQFLYTHTSLFARVGLQNPPQTAEIHD
jgi:hypothetical protein